MTRDGGYDSEDEEDDGEREEYADDMEYDYGNGDKKPKREYLPRLDPSCIGTMGVLWYIAR